MITEEIAQKNFNRLLHQLNQKVSWEKGDQTMERVYWPAMSEFIRVIGQNYGLKKIEKLQNKHIETYFNYSYNRLKNGEIGLSALKGKMAAVQKLIFLAGCKEKLVSSEELYIKYSVPEKIYGRVNRHWTEKEIEEALRRAKEMGRMDVYHAIKLAWKFGLRIEGCTTMNVKALEMALKDGKLTIGRKISGVKEKHNKSRQIKIRTEEQRQVLEDLLKYCKENGINRPFADAGNNLNTKKRSKNFGVGKAKQGIQKWLYGQRGDFQDKKRLPRKEVDRIRTEIVMKEKAKEDVTEYPWSEISLHGLRHNYAIDRFREMLKTGVDRKTAKSIISLEIGHGAKRNVVRRVYLDEMDALLCEALATVYGGDPLDYTDL